MIHVKMTGGKKVMTLKEILDFNIEADVKIQIKNITKGIRRSESGTIIFNKGTIDICPLTESDYIIYLLSFNEGFKILYVDCNEKTVDVIMKGGDVEMGSKIYLILSR